MFFFKKNHSQLVIIFFVNSILLNGCSDNSKRDYSPYISSSRSQYYSSGFSDTQINFDNAKRFALIIGNAHYQANSLDKLDNDINDANDMASLLKNAFNFDEVQTIIDADEKNTTRKISEFANKVKSYQGQKVALFYYSGHGIEIDGTQYIIPIDASAEDKLQFTRSAIPVKNILAVLGEQDNQLNLLILDACRNNPFSKAFGIKTKGGEVLNGYIQETFKSITNSLTGTLIATATSSGDTASPVGERNSIYTKHLLSILRKKTNDDIRLLLDDVANAVNEETHGGQMPWHGGLIKGRFSLASFEPVNNPIPTNIAKIETSNNKTAQDNINDWQKINRYLVKDDLVKDTQTHLMWQRCSVGQKWNGTTCQGDAKTYTRDNAMKLNHSSDSHYNDWRLPTIKELKTLVYCSSGQPTTWNSSVNTDAEEWQYNGCTDNSGYTRPTLLTEVFPNMPENYPWYWSASPVANDSNDVWIVDFDLGVYGGWYNKNNGNFVRLVRAGQ
ncbi:MAG: caspase family protein [Methylococcaceae bacterium]